MTGFKPSVSRLATPAADRPKFDMSDAYGCWYGDYSN